MISTTVHIITTQAHLKQAGTGRTVYIVSLHIDKHKQCRHLIFFCCSRSNSLIQVCGRTMLNSAAVGNVGRRHANHSRPKRNSVVHQPSTNIHLPSFKRNFGWSMVNKMPKQEQELCEETLKKSTRMGVARLI